MSQVGLVGRKCGMTRVFSETGESIPVSVIELLPNYITQVKDKDTDGYAAVQITTGFRKRSRVNRPMTGHFAKAGVEPGRGVWEFSLSEKILETSQFKLGDFLPLDQFKAGEYVKITGISKGKGMAGTVKRHNFATQDATHGNSRSHRVPGSIGQNQTPGRVFKGKKMCGHMGAKQTTMIKLEVIRVEPEKNILLVKGGVPGAPGGNLIIRPSVKRKRSV